MIRVSITIRVRFGFIGAILDIGTTLPNIHCVSKNVPPLQLAIIFTYTVRL